MPPDPTIPDPSITVARKLDRPAQEAVHRLVADSEAVDQGAALNEAALLHLRHPDDRVRHLQATRSGQLIGYAQLEAGGDQTTGQLLVAPAYRRQGVGTLLVQRMLTEAVTPLQIWAAGDRPAAQALAARTSMQPVRTLLIMTRPLRGDLADPVPVPGVQIRTFVPGRDEEAWLAVNAAAFAHHPEQGRMTIDDLRDRMAESWFDPNGFFLAVRDDAVVGFHWTKQHPNRLGEVYVLGVDPARGRGLGKALLLTGLRHLEHQGNSVVQLYVEADHARAVGLYQAYGFSTASRDVMYAQQAETAAQEM
ncbi:MAG TPA: mycothiol synthase [Propionibacteriaceae bacterium]|nr:mycothiol synthase [Propionibacteriaceae bacterium]